MSGPRHNLTPDRDTPPVARHRDIACRDEEPEVFFPPTGGSPAQALAICRRCPHATECLDWAIATDQRHGVWGGTTGPERERIAERRGRA